MRAKLIEINGIKKTIPEWCDEYGISRSVGYKMIQNGTDPKVAFLQLKFKIQSRGGRGDNYRNKVKTQKAKVLKEKKLKRRRSRRLEYAEPQVRQILTYNGKTQSVIEWAEETGIGVNTLRYRIRAGYHIEKIFFNGHSSPAPSNDIIDPDRIDEGVDSWHYLMSQKGYCLRNERIATYKQLKKDYEYYKSQGMFIAA